MPFFGLKSAHLEKNPRIHLEEVEKVKNLKKVKITDCLRTRVVISCSSYDDKCPFFSAFNAAQIMRPKPEGLSHVPASGTRGPHQCT
jgi:hypothetical protein